MKKRHTAQGRRLIVFLVLMVSMLLLGISYSAWTSQLQIQSKITTGKLNIVFQKEDSGDYSASIVDEQNQTIDSLSAEFNFKENDKKVEILFQQGLPMKQLCQGNRIKIDFTLKKAEDNVIDKLDEVSLDFSKPSEKVEFKVFDCAYSMSGKLYALENVASIFTESLYFDLHRQLEIQQDTMKGSVYLSLTPESIAFIEALPNTLTASNLEEYTGNNAERFQSQSMEGAVILYSCEFPFLIEQKELALKK